ncbi:MAG: hypothetical protein RLZZ184_2743 [Cyanobacteriota bacterium]|jgi:hypothetical protein
MTNLAEHLDNISHDQINYFLKNEKLTPRLLWDNVKDIIVPDENAYIIFDDTVLDKRLKSCEGSIVEMRMASSKVLE